MADKIVLPVGVYEGMHCNHSHHLQKKLIMDCEFIRIGLAGFFKAPNLSVEISKAGITIQIYNKDCKRQALAKLSEVKLSYFCAELCVLFLTILPDNTTQFLKSLHLPLDSLGHDPNNPPSDKILLRFSRPLVDSEVSYMAALSSRINGKFQSGQFSIRISQTTALSMLDECGVQPSFTGRWNFRNQNDQKNMSSRHNSPKSSLGPKNKRLSILSYAGTDDEDYQPRNKRVCPPPRKSFQQTSSILQLLLNEQAETKAASISQRNYHNTTFPFLDQTQHGSHNPVQDFPDSGSEDRQITQEAPASLFPSSSAGNKGEFIEKKVQPRFSHDTIRDFTYSPMGSDGIKLINDDVLSLNHGNFINDVIINFYLKYLLNDVVSEKDRLRTHVFNTFFYTHLSSELTEKANSNIEQMKMRHAKVSKWTKRVNIFEKDFVIIPMNEDQHWFLAVVCFPWLVGSVNYRKLFNSKAAVDSNVPLPNSKEAAYVIKRDKIHQQIEKEGHLNPMPCILLFDSLFGASRSPNVKVIREYLQAEWDVKQAETNGNLVFNKDTIRGFCPRVPQQPNHYDCGVYALHYAETFFKKPVTSFTKGYFQDKMKNWFDIATDIDGKRADIQDLIISKYRAQKS